MPPGVPNSFIFMQFSAKKVGYHTHLGVGTPPRKILDPPLMSSPKGAVADPGFSRGGGVNPPGGA